ncbi:hypothetical protein LTR08_003693 [Meristemomyces frigidus]|nr:hypothetical protein LTR08_003693 [Meristemomyces frigidus]
MPTNRSVWQDQPGQPGTIRESEAPSTLDARHVLVKVHAKFKAGDKVFGFSINNGF